ncbi:MAG: hypothetical protein JST04_04260 [Bdellovibrionales bacterium]|nr:hypothetical protein [Bdellovibrionales bacterium]
MKNFVLALVSTFVLGCPAAFAATSTNIQNCVLNSVLNIDQKVTVNQFTGEKAFGKFATLTCTGPVAQKLYVELGDDAGVRKVKDNGVNYMFFGNSPSLTKCFYTKATMTYTCTIELNIQSDVLFQ